MCCTGSFLGVFLSPVHTSTVILILSGFQLEQLNMIVCTFHLDLIPNVHFSDQSERIDYQAVTTSVTVV